MKERDGEEREREREKREKKRRERGPGETLSETCQKDNTHAEGGKKEKEKKTHTP